MNFFSNLGIESSSEVFRDELLEVDKDVAQLRAELATLKQEMHFQKLPLGTIISWIPKPFRNVLDHTVPKGFVVCDGSTIPEGPWKGQRTPNLMDEFLRGGDWDNYLDIQQDAIKDHEHLDEGHDHCDGGHDHW